MNFSPNPLCFEMLKIFSTYYCNVPEKEREVIEIYNEGGMRSGKTFDFFEFLVCILSNNQNADWRIYCFRDTLKACKERTFADFKECLKIMQVWDENAVTAENIAPVYRMYGSTIYFRGLDECREGVKAHICYYNEAIDCTEVSVENSGRRCEILKVFDWNPKYTAHWLFEREGRKNCWWTVTTYRNNSYISPAMKKQIESYSPWLLEDMHLPECERRPNLENIRNKTANKADWLIYGCGIRAAREGLVFPDVSWTDQAPEDFEKRYFGIDFGNTTGINAFTDNRLTTENGRIKITYDCPIYSKFETTKDFYAIIKQYRLEDNERQKVKGLEPVQWIIYCDIAAPQKISDLNTLSAQDELRCVFVGARKFEGCVKWRTDIMKRHEICLVRRSWIRKEQENYRYASVNGIQLDEPEKAGYDHFWDSCGYSIQYDQSLRC